VPTVPNHWLGTVGILHPGMESIAETKHVNTGESAKSLRDDSGL